MKPRRKPKTKPYVYITPTMKPKVYMRYVRLIRPGDGITKLNPTIKTLWLEALRSNRFRKGRFYLCRVVNGQEEHCAEGVLAELAVERGICQRIWMEELDQIYAYGSEEENDYNLCLLPKRVRDWAGVPGTTPLVSASVLPYNTGTDADLISIGRMNDIGMSFTEIADIIEAHL